VHRVLKSFECLGVADRAQDSTLVLPGFAAGIRNELAAATGSPVEMGPVCAAELPLFFGGSWATPASSS
jgi:CO dehydrogenase/acetyl-CoA synthase gamma subunit (corrinoid Fe-S protein)